MDFEKLEKEKEVFFSKCKNDLEQIKSSIKKAIEIEDNPSLEFNCYKYEMCIEIYNLFKCNGGECGLGYYMRLCGNLENPLQAIFNDYLENFTEKKLIKANDLYKLLDKKGV